MSKKQTPIDYLLSHVWTTDWVNYTYDEKLEVFEEARKMHNHEIEMAKIEALEIEIIKQCAEQSTSEASKYAEGYKEGYKRALEYITDTIKNKIEIKRDGSNIFTTTTSNTAFLCTTFLSDGSMGATLPRCMKCGKTEYTHPIITNTI